MANRFQGAGFHGGVLGAVVAFGQGRAGLQDLVAEAVAFAEQQQALLEGIVRAWAILAVMFVAFDMAVLDALAPPRLSPLDRAVDLHMRQWEGRYIAALLQSTFREETHERPGEDR